MDILNQQQSIIETSSIPSQVLPSFQAGNAEDGPATQKHESVKHGKEFQFKNVQHFLERSSDLSRRGKYKSITAGCVDIQNSKTPANAGRGGALESRHSP